MQLPSGELTVCNGKSPFLMGKSMKIHDFYGHFQLQTVSSPEGMPHSPASVVVWLRGLNEGFSSRAKRGQISPWIWMDVIGDLGDLTDDDRVDFNRDFIGFVWFKLMCLL